MFGFFKKRNKYPIPKKSKMVIDSKKSLEELSEELSSLEFQWVKGDFTGSQEFFQSLESEGDLIFIRFKSGNRLNLELASDYLESFPYSGMDFSSIDKVETTNTQIKKKSAEINSVKYSRPEQPVSKNSPIYNLLGKQKPNMVDVSISIKLNLPPKELYDVLISSFEEAEEDIVEYIISSIDIDDIKKAISSSIVESYYSRSKQAKKTPEKTKQENEQ